MTAFSQVDKPITKGNIIISGGATIEYYEYKYYSKNSVFSISLDPGAGFFVIDNLAIGLNTSIGYSKNNSYHMTIVGIGPYVKYYFNNGVFVNLDTFIDKIHENGGTNTTDLSFSPGIGYAFFLNSKVSLEPSVNYKYLHEKSDGGTLNTNFFFLGIKLNIFL